MRCPYCFQPLADKPECCPYCGSRLQEAGVTGQTKSQVTEIGAAPAAGKRPVPVTRQQQLSLLLLGGVLVLCVAGSLVTLVRPALLPRSVSRLLGLATPLPVVTPQVTRATILTPTSIAWIEHVNRRAGFAFSFPAGWLVLEQGQSGWQDDVRDLSEQYGWAETLFETGVNPPAPRTRAVDPATVDLRSARIAVFTVGPVSRIGDNLTLDQIEMMASSEPALLSELAGPLIGSDFTARRSERLQVNDREALLIDFTSATQILAQPVHLRVRLYFIPAAGEIYLVSYFADERLANTNRSVYDQIVQSFRPLR